MCAADESRYFDLGDVTLHAKVRGQGAPVLLLHGFPETHRCWDLQLDALHGAGYQSVALDLRGYGESSRPPSGYDLPTLARDVAKVIEQLGQGALPVIGHDWGGAITWQLCSDFPEFVARAVILDCPHPALMARALRRNPRQLRRSWYMFFFQLPRIPEWWLAADGGRNLSRMFRDGSPSQRIARVLRAETESLLSPGALTPALAYYRTAFRRDAASLLSGRLSHRYETIQLPLTLIWGDADSCLGTELIHGTSRYAAALSVHVVRGAGHFVHQERPEEVNELLLAALAPAAQTLADASSP